MVMVGVERAVFESRGSSEIECALRICIGLTNNVLVYHSTLSRRLVYMMK